MKSLYQKSYTRARHNHDFSTVSRFEETISEVVKYFAFLVFWVLYQSICSLMEAIMSARLTFLYGISILESN